MSIDAMKQALEAIELSHPRFGVATEIYKNAIASLRSAIEHAERPQTHSEECWRWHHQCAVAMIERMQTRSQKLAKAGYKRRPSAKSLPSDE